jgi:hypothetical protein
VAKFSRAARTVGAVGPTATLEPRPTHEGGVGWEKDAKTALFTLAVTNMVGETTFYESANTRDQRYRELVRQVAVEDPAWVAAFIPWLRNHAHMRSASIVTALEYVVAQPTVTTDATRCRRVVDSAMARADEPAEALGYWLSTYGRKIPKPVRRGIADGAARLYTETSYLKYDSSSNNVRMRDVLNLCHPDRGNFGLYKHILDRSYGHFRPMESDLDELGLVQLANAYLFDRVPPHERRQVLRSGGPGLLLAAGVTWERLSGWLPDGMDAEAWETVIPTMGYMAMLRNLRNFEKANISKTVADIVSTRLADPDQVARSRQFPYRFWSAWANSGTMTYGPALEAAMNYAAANVPVLDGTTLVAIDTSASMGACVSARSQVRNVEIGAVFAASLAARNNVDVMIYADEGRRIALPLSILRATEHVESLIGAVGHGTRTWSSVESCYRNQDRIVVFTDMQDHPAASVLPDRPIYVWDLAGYNATNLQLGPDRYLFGGFSDASLALIGLLEAGRDACWPWEMTSD